MKRKPQPKNTGTPTLSTAEEELLQECTDSLDDSATPYPETVIAFALRANLASILTSLIEMETWTHQQASSFIEGLQNDVLAP